MKPLSIIALLVGVLLALTGCHKDPAAAAATGSEAGYTHTLKTTVEYYATGPQQGRPPDGHLAGGTKVKLVEAAGSYSLIESASGKKGYVASDALQPIQ